MSNNISSNQRGNSLIQVLISIGLMGLLMAAFASMMVNQQTETRALSEKFGALDLQQFLTASLADGSVCAYVMNIPTVLTFDSTTPLPHTITLPDPDLNGQRAALYASILPGPPIAPGPVAAQVGKAPSQVARTLVVKSIQLQITQGSSGGYSGNWLVNFDSTLSVRAIKPVSVSTVITADTSIPTAARITGCQSGGIGSFSPSGTICGMREVSCFGGAAILRSI
jgi:hypothetical protein